MIHAQLHSKIPYFEGDTIPDKRKEFNKELREIIALLEDAQDTVFGKVYVQHIIEALRATAENPIGYPEELLTYFLTDSQFFNGIYLTQPIVAEAIKKLLDKYQLSTLISFFKAREAKAFKSNTPNFKVVVQKCTPGRLTRQEIKEQF